MSEGFYKGVQIIVDVYELADNQGFSATITLVRRLGGEDVESRYSPERVFPSREIAKEQANLEAVTIIEREF